MTFQWIECFWLSSSLSKDVPLLRRKQTYRLVPSDMEFGPKNDSENEVSKTVSEVTMKAGTSRIIGNCWCTLWKILCVFCFSILDWVITHTEKNDCGGDYDELCWRLNFRSLVDIYWYLRNMCVVVKKVRGILHYVERRRRNGGER